MSPKNLQTPEEALSVVFPEAANHTNAGNTKRMQAAS